MYTHTDINQRGVHVLIADTIASGSLYQMGSLVGYIIHYHKSDAPTQTGAAWIIKGRYISTCVAVCVWTDATEWTKSTAKNLRIHIKKPNALHYRQRWYTSSNSPSLLSSPSEQNRNRKVWKKRSSYLIDTAWSSVRPLFCCVVLSLVVELLSLSEPVRGSQVTLTLYWRVQRAAGRAW